MACTGDTLGTMAVGSSAVMSVFTQEDKILIPNNSAKKNKLYLMVVLNPVMVHSKCIMLRR